MTPNIYNYKALVTKVYDGDTITVDIDLGMDIILKKQRIRLANINAEPLKTEKGDLAQEWLEQTLLGKTVTIQTIKDRKGKWGRYIGIVWIFDLNINEELVRLDLANSI